jgi:NifU-like protein involved in Fe-S cluster formation
MNTGSEAWLLEYAKNPPNKGGMQDPTIKYHESNRSCGDSLTVYLKIDAEGRVQDFSFEWDTAIMTTAAAAIFGEAIIGIAVWDILNYTFDTVADMLQISISPKRKLAASFALLATRNAIHQFKNDWIVDDFSDVIL